MTDAAPPRESPAATRNAEPIGRVLDDWLRELDGTLLEVGCGTGQHAAALSGRLPGLTWLPTDLEPDVRTVMAWRERASVPARIAAPVRLDAADAAQWRRVRPVDAVLGVNVMHIMPWPTVVGLITNAAAACRAGGWLLLYGPLHVAGEPTGPGNAAFDRSLRAAGGGQGIRDIVDVRAAAAAAGWVEMAHYGMPADNRMLAWRLAAA